MDVPNRKTIIGILGGVGSGKSTAAAEFGKLGCAIIDADEIAHKLLDELGVQERVVSSFGQGILDSAGQIDRKKLADIVFANAQNLSALNEIIHPLVLERAEQLIKQFNSQAEVKAIVLDMPLLVEVGWSERCDKLIFVDCGQQLRVERAEKTGVFSKNEHKIRENFQISLDKKVALADNIIDNNSGFSALAEQVAKIFSYITDNG
ncbi:MAG: dephospho-CoA kinase [Planctomycetota bacterium]|nr:MAG: dephospho-CoA kinase [Planctomycetota bacterium]